MKLKSSVALTEWHPALRYALDVIDETYTEVTGTDATLTSAQDETEGRIKGSLHYGRSDVRCRAADFRNAGLTEPQVREIVQTLKHRLGPDFDVIAERKRTGDREVRWLHVEYDPKA